MMTSGKRFIWILTMAAFLVMTSGCARTNLKRVEDELARDDSGLKKENGQRVEGYLLHSGTRAEFKGRVRLTDQDSLQFWSEGVSDQVGHQGVREKTQIPGPVYALAAVKAFDMKETSIGRTSLLVAGIIAGAVVILGAVIVANEGEIIADAVTNSKLLPAP